MARSAKQAVWLFPHRQALLPVNIASDSSNFASDVSKAMDDLKNSEWDKDFQIEEALDVLPLFTKKDCTYYVWTSHYLFQRIIDHMQSFCDFTSYCIWNKPNPMPSLSKRHWTWNTELCVYGTRGSKRIVNFPSEGHALSVWTVTKKSDGSHPTQKPIELCEPPIIFNSNIGSLILDLFLGSGSTLITCEQVERICYGQEFDPKYCDVIVRRWVKYMQDNNRPYTVKRNGEILTAEQIAQYTNG